MPTKPVSGPTAGRICSISAFSSCSASGSGLPGIFYGFRGALLYHNPRANLRYSAEISVQDALRGHGVEPGLEPRAACPGRAQQPLRLVGSQTLIHQLGADAEPALQALREAPGELADGMLRAVGVRRQADYQQRRPPLGDQPLDGGEARAGLGQLDRCEGVGEAGLEIAYRDADAPGAEI